MKKIPLIYGVLLLAFTACKKDDGSNPDNTKVDTPPLTPNAFSYLPSTKGSYWVYETYTVDSDGIEKATGQFDSCYVTGDTMIGNVKYIGYYNFSPHERNKITYLANFNGELKTNHGMVYFDTKDYTKTLGSSAYTQTTPTGIDTIYTTKRTAKKFSGEIIVPAGEFDNPSIQHSLTISVNPKYQISGQPNSVTEETFYHREIGPIKQQYYFFSNRNVVNEWRLIRYHIEP